MPEFLNFKVVITIIVIIALIIILLTGYVKAPPDEAFIISGLRKKVIIGKASIKVPFLERIDKLQLSLISVDVKTQTSVPTADYINVKVDSVVNIKISDEPEMLNKASQNFLNKNPDYIRNIAKEVLEGNTREIVGQMPLESMVNDRKAFAEKVQENAAPDLRAMGLEIISFNVQNFTDDQGLIENLGIDNTTKIQKNAAIAKAESEKEIQIAQSKAKKEANDARIASETEIAQKNNDLAIRKAELKKQSDISQATADMAYEIQQEEQRKSKEIATAEANIAKTEQQIILNTKEAEVKEKSLDAEVKKKADADRYAKQQASDAELYQQQRKAEAERFKQEQDAEAEKAIADKEKYKKEKEAEAEKSRAEAEKFAKLQEAEGIEAVGKAEAEAIRAKALAEAEGIEKKAEAMKKYGEAAVLEMYFKALPEMVKNAAEPLNNVDSIIMYGDGNTAKLTQDTMKTISQVTEAVKQSSGIDLAGIVKAFTQSKTPQIKDDITDTLE